MLQIVTRVRPTRSAQRPAATHPTAPIATTPKPASRAPTRLQPARS